MGRRSISLSFATSIGLAAVVVGVPGPARGAPSKQECVDDNAAAQELRRQGHFADASDRLERCAVLACPEIVRDDCTRRLDEIKVGQPTLVFDVQSPAGKDIVAVQVLLDGHPFTDHLDGTPLKIDPGPHDFTFAIPGEPPVTERLLIREGESARHERVIIGRALPPPVAATPPALPPVAPPAPPVVPDRGLGRRQIVGLLAAGVGGVSAVVGTVYGLKARTAWNEAQTACGGDPSHCADAASANPHRSQAVRDGTVSTTAFIGGAALIAGGAVPYLTGGEGRENKTGGVALSATADPGHLGVVLLGAF